MHLMHAAKAARFPTRSSRCRRMRDAYCMYMAWSVDGMFEDVSASSQ